MRALEGGRRWSADNPMPGMPGRLRVVAGVIAVAVIVGDAVWLKGAVFTSGPWRAFLWLLVAVGLLLGAWAASRRGR
jgi:VIT1/CCC1 family predicted Fe2+/Mn2+ transporter